MAQDLHFINQAHHGKVVSELDGIHPATLQQYHDSTVPHHSHLTPPDEDVGDSEATIISSGSEAEADSSISRAGEDSSVSEAERDASVSNAGEDFGMSEAEQEARSRSEGVDFSDTSGE